MKKSISVVMMLLLVLLSFSTSMSNNVQSISTSTTHQTTAMSNSQLQSVEGGVPILNIMACEALLVACLEMTNGWWADLGCMALTAACLAL